VDLNVGAIDRLNIESSEGGIHFFEKPCDIRGVGQVGPTAIASQWPCGKAGTARLSLLAAAISADRSRNHLTIIPSSPMKLHVKLHAAVH
jgi:hypothetical protein